MISQNTMEVWKSLPILPPRSWYIISLNHCVYKCNIIALNINIQYNIIIYILFIYLFIYLFVYLFICLFIYLFIHILFLLAEV